MSKHATKNNDDANEDDNNHFFTEGPDHNGPHGHSGTVFSHNKNKSVNSHQYQHRGVHSKNSSN